jgi:hypothetical protein
MNIVLVTEEAGIEVYKTWSQLKKETSFKKEDFAQIGTDYILNCTLDTFEVAKDIKTLERVASERVFAKSKMSGSDMAAFGAFIMTVLIFFQ